MGVPLFCRLNELPLKLVGSIPYSGCGGAWTAKGGIADLVDTSAGSFHLLSSYHNKED